MCKFLNILEIFFWFFSIINSEKLIIIFGNYGHFIHNKGGVHVLFLWRLRGYQSAPNCFGMSTKCISDQIHKKKFLFFSKYFFFRIESKNIVCLDLTTETSKYRLDISQLHVQCSTGFLLSLLSKKSEHIFFRKIIFSSLHRNLQKKASYRSQACNKVYFEKVWAFSEI
jgi:hypothetical protein